jgi:acyl-[acyl carrier protein]--UDP-N-acetylglucosamine O-acyltransferase
MLTSPAVPRLDDLAQHPPAELGQLEQRNIHVRGRTAENRVYLKNAATRCTRRLVVQFDGTDNRIYVDENCGMEGTIRFCNDGGTAFIFGGQRCARVSGTIYAGGTFIWGSGASSFGMTFWCDGGRKIVIGEDCLFSENIRIRSSDQHSVIDLASKRQINFPADVAVGRHVWIGADVSVLKGVTIGDGSIVGAGSLVSKPVPDRQLWAGVPAKRVRRNVSWVASHPAHEAGIRALEFRYGLISE